MGNRHLPISFLLKIHVFIQSSTPQTFAKGPLCAGRAAGMVDAAVNQPGGPGLPDLASEGEEADNTQRNNKDMCQVVVSAVEGKKKKAGGGDSTQWCQRGLLSGGDI